MLLTDWVSFEDWILTEEVYLDTYECLGDCYDLECDTGYECDESPPLYSDYVLNERDTWGYEMQLRGFTINTPKTPYPNLKLV
ncbi:MAG: hypothetical protein DRP42_06550 [Tenericutes bacterium]|nr:MAG: hypothetical protein DRP42_06550 [Mycoplasmatota bacterium]